MRTKRRTRTPRINANGEGVEYAKTRKQATEAAVAAFLAKGKEVTKLPPGQADGASPSSPLLHERIENSMRSQGIIRGSKPAHER